MRVFVAAHLAVSAANALAAAAATLARRAREAGVDIRWVAPVNYHITIKFLGETRSEVVAAIRDSLAAAVDGTSAIPVRCARIGGFPSLERGRVVWAGIEDASGGLAALAARIDEHTHRLGFAAEPRPFHGHITLGRVRETRPLKEVVLPMAEQMFGAWSIDGISLMESETKSTGSVYRQVAKFVLSGAVSSPISRSERQTAPLELDGHRDEDTDDGWPREV